MLYREQYRALTSGIKPGRANLALSWLATNIAVQLQEAFPQGANLHL